MDWIGKCEKLLDPRPGRPEADSDRPTLARFAAAIGKPRRTAQNILLRVNRPTGESELIRRAARFFKVSESWLRDPGTGFPPVLEGDEVAAAIRTGGPAWRALYECMDDARLRPKVLAYARGLLASRNGNGRAWVAAKRR